MRSKRTRQRADGQLTGLAGEFFVAAELLRRGLQVALTLGNAKDIDLFAYHPDTGKRFTVQVKALRTRSVFPIRVRNTARDHVYVFVVPNRPGSPPDYFIVPGVDLIETPDKFSRWLSDPKFPSIPVTATGPGVRASFSNARIDELGYGWTGSRTQAVGRSSGRAQRTG